MNPYAIIGGILILVASFLSGANVGSKMERATWQKEKLQQQALYEEHIRKEFKKYAADIKTQQSNARKASEDHDKALSELDQKHRDTIADIRRLGGLRISGASCKGRDGPAAPAQGAGAGGPDGEAAGTVRIPADVEERLFALARRADGVVEQCRALQDWVRLNGHYGQTE